MYQRKVQIISKSKTPSTSADVTSAPPSTLSPPLLSLPPQGQWITVDIPNSYQPTYLSPNRFVVRLRSFERSFKDMQAEMNAHYSILSFTKEKRDKRGVMGEDRLVLGAVFAAYVRDLRSWARVIVKAPNGSKEVVVFLPDHGFFCAVKIRQMWDLEPQFGKLPFQAFVASIPIASPGLTDRWSPEAVQVFKEAVVKRQLLGQIFSITSNAEQFPAVTVVFSALYASTSNADVSHHMEPHHEVGALSRDREKTVSIVDLMIENCHAKFKGE